MKRRTQPKLKDQTAHNTTRSLRSAIIPQNYGVFGLSAALDVVMDWEPPSPTTTASAHPSEETIDSAVTATSCSGVVPIFVWEWEGGSAGFPLGRTERSWEGAPQRFAAIAEHYHLAAVELRELSKGRPYSAYGTALPESVVGPVTAEYRRRYAAVNPRLGAVDAEACYPPPGRWTTPADRVAWTTLCPPRFQPRGFFSLPVLSRNPEPFDATELVLQLREDEADEDEAELIFGGAARQAEEYPLAPIPRKRQRTYVPPAPSAAQLHHVHAAHHLRRGVALSAPLLTRR